MEIFRLLDFSLTVSFYRILDFKAWRSGFYIKIQITLSNNTYLYAREYSDDTDRKYSFHWQNKNGALISRWDNSPHHKHIKTFPHHKHENESVVESFDISLKDVIGYIEGCINAEQ